MRRSGRGSVARHVHVHTTHRAVDSIIGHVVRKSMTLIPVLMAMSSPCCSSVRIQVVSVRPILAT